MREQTTQQYPQPSARRPTDQQPLLLGRYRIMQTGVNGGFGTVLTCWDTRLQRRVAIKRIPLASQGGVAGGASTIDEALAEARTSSMLAHPNIVTMFDFEVDHAYAYLVMEYVDGLTLSEFLARVEGGTLTGDECAYLVSSVSKALSFAHENGVLHLDIKPSNIMIEHSGTIKLCDFGMATLASATGYGGARGGTVGYMPPEQVEGGLVDERSDIFSLAVVVWQALTGQNPFAAKTAEESLRKIQKGPKTPLSKIDPSLAGMAEEVVMQALNPNPALRVPSVEAFSNELSFGLGDPEVGAQSIRSLMAQDEKDVAFREEEFRPEELPLTYRYPWLPGAVTRTASGVACAAVCWSALPVVLSGDASAPVVGSLLCGAAAAAWPPLGSTLALVACALAFGTPLGSAASVLLPLLMALCFLAWWVPVGSHERLSTCAVLVPCMLGRPLTGVAISAFALDPAAAAGTVAVGFAWSLLLSFGEPLGFDAALSARAFLDYLLTPSAMLLLAGSCLVAALVSAVYRWRGTVASGIAMQVVGLFLLIFTQLVAIRVENGGIWASPSGEAILFEIVLSVIVCIATNLRGPLPADEGAEVIDESA